MMASHELINGSSKKKKKKKKRERGRKNNPPPRPARSTSKLISRVPARSHGSWAFDLERFIELQFQLTHIFTQPQNSPSKRQSLLPSVSQAGNWEPLMAVIGLQFHAHGGLSPSSVREQTGEGPGCFPWTDRRGFAVSRSPLNAISVA